MLPGKPTRRGGSSPTPCEPAPGATQFHEFAGQLLTRVPGPVAVLPRQRIRPVAAVEVAAELVRLAVGEPQGPGPELAGPEEHQLVELARRVVRASGR